MIGGIKVKGKKKERYTLADWVIGFFLLCFGLAIVYPVWYLFMLSFSTFGGISASSNPFMLTPAVYPVRLYGDNIPDGCRNSTFRFFHGTGGLCTF